MITGLYGGTFNPIHFGHLRAAEEIYERFGMKEVVFIPSANPPHKDSRDAINPNHRLKMVGLGITGNDHFSVSDLEYHRQGKSYSIDTVRELRRLRPDETLAFILGLDAFLEIHTWHKYEEIFGECDFIVTTRPGAARVSCQQAIPEAVARVLKRKGPAREWIHPSGHRVVFTEVTDMAISATTIRTLVREGKSVRYLLPIRVNEYIQDHGLYK
jgi:nicotinate-nucleotide adenylyltransferase